MLFNDFKFLPYKTLLLLGVAFGKCYKNHDKKSIKSEKIKKNPKNWENLEKSKKNEKIKKNR